MKLLRVDTASCMKGIVWNTFEMKTWVTIPRTICKRISISPRLEKICPTISRLEAAVTRLPIHTLFKRPFSRPRQLLSYHFLPQTARFLPYVCNEDKLCMLYSNKDTVYELHCRWQYALTKIEETDSFQPCYCKQRVVNRLHTCRFVTFT